MGHGRHLILNMYWEVVRGTSTHYILHMLTSHILQLYFKVGSKEMPYGSERSTTDKSSRIVITNRKTWRRMSPYPMDRRYYGGGNTVRRSVL